MKYFNVILIFALIMGVLSCNKSDRDDDTTTNSSADYAMGQSLVYDAFKLVHQAALSSKGITTNNLADTVSLFGCDTIIVDTLTNPMAITLRFDSIGCSGNGNNRSGSITATFSSKYDILGCLITISFDNYTYNGQPIGGSISYAYSSVTGTSPAYTFNANKVAVTNSKGFMKWSGNQRITISSGEATAATSDDSYLISGSASGTTYKGNNFSAIIKTDLVLLGSCNWVSTGIVSVTPENKTPRTLDFGSSCDATATVSINSTNYEITIP